MIILIEALITFVLGFGLGWAIMWASDGRLTKDERAAYKWRKRVEREDRAWFEKNRKMWRAK